MLEDRDVGAETPILGACPDCGVPIPSANLLIRYERAGEWPRFLAACPRCGEPVHPA
jgi:endogenous inhibitor of DNA gyrase (YacG/DUF329 family)